MAKAMTHKDIGSRELLPESPIEKATSGSNYRKPPPGYTANYI
jgi:hypothetical protein